MGKAYLLETFRSIKRTLNRFLAIFAIVALGAGFFGGLKAASIDMKLTADKYYDDYKLMDIRVISALGLTEEDVSSIRLLPGIENVMPAYSVDTITRLQNRDVVVRVQSLPEDTGTEQMNRLKLLEGRLPENSGECVLDSGLILGNGLGVGDTIELKSADETGLTETLKTSSYTIVGTVESPTHISYERGNSTKGNGQISFNLFIPRHDFQLDVYTEVYVTVSGARGEFSFNDSYKNMVDSKITALEDISGERCAIRFNDVKDEANEKLSEAEQKLADAEEEANTKLNDAKKKIDDAKAEIADGEEALQSGKEQIDKAESQLRKQKANFKSQTAQARVKLDEGWAAYKNGLSGYNLNRSKLDALPAQITALRQNADSLAAAGKLAEAQAMYANAAALESQYSSGLAELNKAKAELDASYTLLSSQETEFQKITQEAKAKLQKAQREIDKAKKELSDGETELEEARQKLADGEKEYNDAKTETDQKLSDARNELNDNKKKIQELEMPEWFILDRESNPGYTSFGQNAKRIDAIAQVFPVFFFLVAALVCLTTMTRMVEEERLQIGTMKALGYGKFAIACKYLLYAALASILGNAGGLLVGFVLFPAVIWNAYDIIYSMPPISTPFNTEFAVISIAVTLLCTVLSAWAACYKELASTPAALMRPKAPKPGKRVWLENIKPVWSRLSFSRKLMLRNIFRYKKRLLMTVLGIAGCTALMLAGFGLKDSIMNIVHNQFKNIYKFDMMLVMSDKSVDEQRSSVTRALDESGQIQNYIFDYRKLINASAGGKQLEVYLIVPQDSAAIRNFITFRDRKSGNAIDLSSGGVIINEKMALILGLGVGDQITIEDLPKKSFKITGITENYIYNYIYMPPELYAAVYGKQPSYNQMFILTAGISKDTESELSTRLLKNENVTAITFTSDMVEEFSDVFNSLNSVVLVIIFSAGLLAFIVLYNLININITERIREIATIKVLGFYDIEVSDYVNRESIILTMIGILIGLIMGIFLHQYVVSSSEMEAFMFGREINAMSYLYATLLTLGFSLIVNFVMHFRLKQINMVESLKSIE